MTLVAAATTAGAAAPAIRAIDLAVGYRVRRQRRAVLEHVNLAADRGELICLLGPNGIGKSTLLRTLTRLQPRLWGSVELDGRSVDGLTSADLARRIGIVLTDRVIVGSLTARQVVELGRYPHSGWFGYLTTRDWEVVEWALGIVGASHLADRDISQLSDGERQRVMIARALAQEPLLLVLDEPTAYLDVASRVELMGLLRQLSRDSGLAVLMSTHDLELALRTADRAWLLLPGGDVVSGSPEDVIVSGAIAQAFEGRHIRFDAAARSFRWLAGDRSRARVRGEGLRAAMAAAVLEREGYDVDAGDDGTDALCVDVDESGWRAHVGEQVVDGEDFASLAAALRRSRRPLGLR